MRTIKQFMFVALIALAFASCNQKETVAPAPQSDDGYLKTGPYCGNTIYKLFDETGNYAGTLQINNARSTTYFYFRPINCVVDGTVPSLIIDGDAYPFEGNGNTWFDGSIQYTVAGLGPDGTVSTFATTISTDCGDLTASGSYTFDDCNPLCYGSNDETAWADGERYVQKGNWATYTSYEGQAKTVTLWAGQNMLAGIVNFKPYNASHIKITITLDKNWGFNPNESENVKIQDYKNTPPSKNPKVGQFDWKYFVPNVVPNVHEFIIDKNNFYGVHVDVVGAVPCE